VGTGKKKNAMGEKAQRAVRVTPPARGNKGRAWIPICRGGDSPVSGGGGNECSKETPSPACAENCL